MTDVTKSSWQAYYKSKRNLLLFELISSIKNLHQHPLFKEIYKFVKLNPNDQSKLILETGIGIGTFSIGLANLGYRIVGIDLSSDALKVLKEFIIKNKINNLNLIQADIRAIPLQSVFSHVLSLGVIEHFQNPILALKQTIIPLSPVSLLFIDTPNKDGLFNRIYSIRRRYEQKKGIWPLGFERSFSIKELRKFFEIVKMEPLIEMNLDVKLALAAATHFSSHINSIRIIQRILNIFFHILNPIIKRIPSFITNFLGFYSIIIASKCKNK